MTQESGPPEDNHDEELEFEVTPVISTYVEEEVVVSGKDDEDEFDAINDTDVVEDVIDTEDESVPQADDTTDIEDDEQDISYPDDKLDFRGESLEELRDLLQNEVATVGGTALDARVRTVGSWENIVMRAILDDIPEENRERNALKLIADMDGALPKASLKNDAGKTLLRTSAINPKFGATGETTTVSGDDAILAFSSKFSKRGGCYRVPLYNSGITIDILTPTGIDLQTLLVNCIQVERQLGAENGAHYFTYADQLYKTQIINFIQPLITASSYADWRKKGKLWSIIKLPDLVGLVMTMAAICHRDGFDGFVTKCTRPRDEEHPEGCHHTETFKANLFDMVITRMSALSKESIDFMVNARTSRNAKNTTTQIAKYQEGLGLEGEKIVFDNLSFTMRIPTVTEHMEAGAQFLSDVINEIEGDNSEGQYAHVGFRYMRTLLPWIAVMEMTAEDGSVLRTGDRRAITRTLEELDNEDPGDAVRNKFVNYIDKVQLTYVGYPALPCVKCSHVANTPSGLLTIDPFSAFFMLAFLYLKQTESAAPKD